MNYNYSVKIFGNCIYDNIHVFNSIKKLSLYGSTSSDFIQLYKINGFINLCCTKNPIK